MKRALNFAESVTKLVLSNRVHKQQARQSYERLISDKNLINRMNKESQLLQKKHLQNDALASSEQPPMLPFMMDHGATEPRQDALVDVYAVITPLSPIESGLTTSALKPHLKSSFNKKAF